MDSTVAELGVSPSWVRLHYDQVGNYMTNNSMSQSHYLSKTKKGDETKSLSMLALQINWLKCLLNFLGMSSLAIICVCMTHTLAWKRVLEYMYPCV